MTTGFKGFLAMYRYFYGKNYAPYYDPNKNGLNHLRSQCLYYLLHYFAMDINLCGYTYGYTWSKNRPHSNRLEDDLGVVDTKKEEIKAFYKDEYDEKQLELFIYPSVLVKLNLFKRTFLSEVVLKLLEELKHPIDYWVWLLASIAFIKNIEMPYIGFSSINKEMIRRRAYWSGVNTLNKEAWNLLQIVGIIKVDTENKKKKEEKYGYRDKTGTGIKGFEAS